MKVDEVSEEYRGWLIFFSWRLIVCQVDYSFSSFSKKVITQGTTASTDLLSRLATNGRSQGL